MRTPPLISVTLSYIACYRCHTYISDDRSWTVPHIQWVIESEESITSRASSLKLAVARGYRRGGALYAVAAIISRLLCQALATVGAHKGTTVQDHWKTRERERERDNINKDRTKY